MDAEKHALYKKAEDDYVMHSRDYMKIEESISSSKTQMKNVKDALFALESRKNSFEARLSEIKKIIKFFENDISNSIDRYNKVTINTDECYRTAFKCDSYSPASITDSFKALNVHYDRNLNLAYNLCAEEKDRITQKLIEFDANIKKAKIDISILNDRIVKYNNQRMECKDQIKTCLRKMNLYK